MAELSTKTFAEKLLCTVYPAWNFKTTSWI